MPDTEGLKVNTERLWYSYCYICGGRGASACKTREEADIGCQLCGAELGIDSYICMFYDNPPDSKVYLGGLVIATTVGGEATLYGQARFTTKSITYKEGFTLPVRYKITPLSGVPRLLGIVPSGDSIAQTVDGISNTLPLAFDENEVYLISYGYQVDGIRRVLSSGAVSRAIRLRPNPKTIE
jgi:hypothetical protein